MNETITTISNFDYNQLMNLVVVGIVVIMLLGGAYMYQTARGNRNLTDALNQQQVTQASLVTSIVTRQDTSITKLGENQQAMLQGIGEITDKITKAIETLGESLQSISVNNQMLAESIRQNQQKTEKVVSDAFEITRRTVANVIDDAKKNSDLAVSKINDVTNEIANLKGDLSVMQTEAKDLKQEVTEIKGMLQSIVTTLDTIIKQIDQLKDKDKPNDTE
jgi:methyl-accepting chemotaxis protein